MLATVLALCLSSPAAPPAAAPQERSAVASKERQKQLLAEIHAKNAARRQAGGGTPDDVADATAKGPKDREKLARIEARLREIRLAATRRPADYGGAADDRIRDAREKGYVFPLRSGRDRERSESSAELRLGRLTSPDEFALNRVHAVVRTWWSGPPDRALPASDPVAVELINIFPKASDRVGRGLVVVVDGRRRPLRATYEAFTLADVNAFGVPVEVETVTAVVPLSSLRAIASAKSAAFELGGRAFAVEADQRAALADLAGRLAAGTARDAGGI